MKTRIQLNEIGKVQTINAIKAVRENTGFGLKEAKDIVDELRNGGWYAHERIHPTDNLRAYFNIANTVREQSSVKIKALLVEVIEGEDWTLAKELISLIERNF